MGADQECFIPFQATSQHVREMPENNGWMTPNHHQPNNKHAASAYRFHLSFQGCNITFLTHKLHKLWEQTAVEIWKLRSFVKPSSCAAERQWLTVESVIVHHTCIYTYKLNIYTPKKLTWIPKMMVWKTKLLGKDAMGKWPMFVRRWFGKGNSLKKMAMFGIYVRFPGCTHVYVMN